MKRRLMRLLGLWRKEYHPDFIVERGVMTCYGPLMCGTFKYRDRVESFSTPERYVELCNRHRKVVGWPPISIDA